MSKKITIDDLGIILNKEFGNINKEFGNINKEFKNVHAQLKELKQGQKNIELKLTNVAYRFEMKELEGVVEALKQRVEILERR